MNYFEFFFLLVYLFGHIKFQKKKVLSFVPLCLFHVIKSYLKFLMFFPHLYFLPFSLSLEEPYGVWSFSPEKYIMCTKVSILLYEDFLGRVLVQNTATASRTFGNSLKMLRSACDPPTIFSSTVLLQYFVSCTL